MTEATKEYAVALYALARETGQADAWGEGLRRIEAALKADPDWAQLLSCPAVPLREREALIEEAFSASLPGELIALVKLLCERGRMGQFHAVEAEYLHMLDSMNQISEAKVVSAAPLGEEEQTRLKAVLEKRSGHRVVLNCSVDESLLGGMIVEMDGHMADGSLRSRLREVKEVISS
ncbi:MAG: ATP synthase F1 subunit delta [Clostridia bacterium]|nr:ATP synthase F1 subunit delta [Clostridia bacterium]